MATSLKAPAAERTGAGEIAAISHQPIEDHTAGRCRARLAHRFLVDENLRQTAVVTMPQDGGMAASGDRAGSPVAQLKALIGRVPPWLHKVDDGALGEELVEIRESVVQLEAVFAGGLRRFDTSGEYKA